MAQETFAPAIQSGIEKRNLCCVRLLLPRRAPLYATGVCVNLNAGNNADDVSASDTIMGNSALNGLGGGVWNSGFFSLTDGQITYNGAYYGGGGVDNTGMTLKLYSTDVEYNSVTNGNGGGLLLSANSTTTFDNGVVIKGNTAKGAGAGLGAGIGYYSGATMNFAKPYPGDQDDPGGNPVQVN